MKRSLRWIANAIPLFVAFAVFVSSLGVARAQSDPGNVDEAPVASTEVLKKLDATDQLVEQRLRAVYSSVPRLKTITVDVKHGVVALRGKVSSRTDVDAALKIAKSLEGVVFVDNGLTQTIAFGERIGSVNERISSWITVVTKKGPIVLLALLALFGCWLLGGAISRRNAVYSAWEDRPMMRQMAQRATRVLFLIGGVVIALEILDATTVVGTILGAAGVAGLAVSLAFRDIAENYLASFMLAARRPFAIGDAVKVGEHQGKVMRLTMRETVLMTYDGNHLSLPNAAVFKANVLNFTRNPRRRFDFLVGAAVDTDLHSAQLLGVQTMLSTPGVVAKPKPYVYVEALGDSNVALRLYAWVDQTHADFQKVRSEAIRRVKTALEDAGVDMPEPIYRVHLQQPPKPGTKTTRETCETAADDVDVSPDETIDRQMAAHDGEHGERNLLDGSDD